jgi:hypothetical protein
MRSAVLWSTLHWVLPVQLELTSQTTLQLGTDCGYDFYCPGETKPTPLLMQSTWISYACRSCSLSRCALIADVHVTRLRHRLVLMSHGAKKPVSEHCVRFAVVLLQVEPFAIPVLPAQLVSIPQ